ncbi:MAG: class I adenylate-forming enzyme family protein [Candidatus Hodarchaeota archaeon]
MLAIPQITLEDYAKYPHRMGDVLAKWAKETPDKKAIINFDTKKEVTWKEFDQTATVIAMALINQLGLKKGDFIATSLPLLTEHVYLMYACYKIGVVIAPLDLRLKPPEVIRCLGLIQAKAYFHLGKTEVADFGALAQAVMKNCPFIEHFIQLGTPDQVVVEGSKSVWEIMGRAKTDAEEAMKAGPASSELLQKYGKMAAEVNEDDGCLVIFTTGTTGFPKPALLSHKNITSQNLCLGMGFDINKDDTMLVNLPPSHVGCTTEQLATPLFFGGTVVMLHIFDPAKSLQAIQDYKVTAFGQIPALFAMEWRLPNYNDYDLSSLKFALYGGQSVTKPFLEKLSTMAPSFGTGLGLTEVAGFSSYSPLDGTVDDILASVGFDMPITPLTIRKPMNDDGTAGDMLPDGETGEVCYTGPQVFLGYVGNEEATKKTISSDGVLYTGDLGFKDDKGLHLVGRSKLVIKPKGYQVYPPEVENFIADGMKDKVASVGLVGQKHDVFTEAIVAFVEKKPNVDLTADEVLAHCKGLAAYKRPSLVIILEPTTMPLNRVAKTDYQVLKNMAAEAVEKERAAGRWDKA